MTEAQIRENYSLKKLNTFGIDVKAKYFVSITSTAELQQILKDPALKVLSKLILGGGSNILFTKDYDGLVIRNEIKGIDVTDENSNFIWLKVGAGENWHQFVLHCVARGLCGIENLSLIPGTVGAAPIQNIGAYGVELKDTFHQLETISLNDASHQVLNNSDCQFGYRDSIFKNSAKNKMVITSVTLRLSKQHEPNLEYGSLRERLKSFTLDQLDIKTISDAVIKIREEKLPNPKVIGNAGSFFKNPIITQEHFNKLQQHFKNIPHFLQGQDQVKVNAAWLIEQLGWKGKQVGGVGVYDKQALVLVNYGQGKGSEVLDLAKQIQHSIKEKFNIHLETEVLIL